MRSSAEKFFVDADFCAIEFIELSTSGKRLFFIISSLSGKLNEKIALSEVGMVAYMSETISLMLSALDTERMFSNDMTSDEEDEEEKS